MRFLWLCLVLLVCGCGKGEIVAAPPPHHEGETDPLETRRRLAGVTGEAVQRPIWAVRVFDEKAGWLAGTPLASTEATPEKSVWGERLAVAVSRALDARRVSSQVVPKNVTPAQMETLFKQGLQYFCEGTLTTVTTAGGNGTLRVAYRLKRRIGEETKTVQARAIEGVTPATVLDDPSMQKLVDAAAEKLADAVVTDVPADLLAIRG